NAWMQVVFDYQGSVTNDTHIRAHSDIDLLTVETKWVNLDHTTQPYTPNAVEDLKKIRRQTASILRGAYTTATVDNSGNKSISVSGGSLRRKIDVISCAWWHCAAHQYQQ